MKKIIFLLIALLGIGIYVQADSSYQLSRGDLKIFYNGFQFALENSPAHRSTSWVNPATGFHGTTIPTKDLRLPSGDFCREYLAKVEVGDISQQTYGTACRLEDGRWNITQEQVIEEYAAMSGGFLGSQQAPSTCPGNLQPNPADSPAVNISPRFSDPYLAHIHRFLSGQSASGRYHNWQELYDRFHGRQFQQRTQPPPGPEKFPHKPFGELVKLVSD